MGKILALKNSTKFSNHHKHKSKPDSSPSVVNGKKRRWSYVEVPGDERNVKRKNENSPSFAGTPKPRKKTRSVGGTPVKTQKVSSIQEQRNQLPITRGREALIREIKDHDVTVLVGETGSGKTTQVPQYLLEAGLAGPSGMIAITQPRKVAATSLASRVALEKETTVGDLVGYSVRFDEASSSSTRIKYVTDGMLIRELLSDPLLSRYSVVIVDEAHERTLRTDLLLANLKTILKERNGYEAGGNAKEKGKGKKGKEPAAKNPLKVVIMSATLDAEKFSKFYNGAKILYVQGRQHPVTIYHTATSQPDYIDSALRTFFQIHTDRPPGDVLIFLPGQEDIENLEKAIKLYADRLPKDAPGVAVYPMYAALPASQQSAIFSPAPQGMRKCILATNIAETSITIPGIKYVIDTGKCKEKRYISRDTGSGFDTLLTRDITQSSAMQRAGRAGREGPGFCFRLYTEDAFKAMPLSAEPEIRRCTLTSSILQLKCLGQDLEELDFMDKPDPDSIGSALGTLYMLGALDSTKSLTKLGRDMAQFPLEPFLARSLLASIEFGCTNEVLDIISVLSCSSKLFHDSTDMDKRESAVEARRKFRHPSGDHLMVLNVLRAYEEISKGQEKGKGIGKSAKREWCRNSMVNERCLIEALDIRKQLRGVCERMGIDWKVSSASKNGDGMEHAVLRSLVRGLLHQSAFLQPDGSYKQVMGPSIVKIHPGSSLSDKKVPAIIYDELIYTTHIYARGVSAIPRSFIAEIAVVNRKS